MPAAYTQVLCGAVAAHLGAVDEGQAMMCDAIATLVANLKQRPSTRWSSLMKFASEWVSKVEAKSTIQKSKVPKN